MGRKQDPGLAVFVDWAARKKEMFEQQLAGWPNLPGNQVYMDLVIDGRTEQTMRLVFALFIEEVPLAAANFFHLCAQTFDGLGEAGHPLTYRRSQVHRIVKGQFLHGGDVTLQEGRGGDSIYGAAGFEDEKFGLGLRHTAAGLLTMANQGLDTNRSQFLVTLGPAPQLDGRNVIIGRIVSGAMHLEVL